jgi:hypothetical protein
VHAIQLFHPLLFRPDVHVLETALPDPESGLVMNRDGEDQPRQQSAVPRMCPALLETAKHEPRGSLFRGLQHARGIRLAVWPDQNMEVVRHEDVSHDLETEMDPEFVEGVEEVLTEALGMKDLHPMIATGLDEVEVVTSIEAVQGATS